MSDWESTADAASSRDPAVPVSRREVLLCVSALLGGAFLLHSERLLAALGKSASHMGASDTASIGAFTAEDIALLDEIAETMLPETRTPGAKAAHTGAFMARMVTDCYSPAEQQVFRVGLSRLDHASRTAHGVSFMAATPAHRLALLEALDREQKGFMDERKKAQRQVPDTERKTHQPAHYFRMMKELALLGYFTSDIGCTQAQRYLEVPGRFEGCIPYRPGEPAWADHA